MEIEMQTATTMNANTSFFAHPLFLRRVLLLDAITCVVTGLAMALGADMATRLTALPSGLLTTAGASLFPTALFMAWVATRKPIPAAGVWLVILGNVGWALGSLILLTWLVPFNALGAGFVMMQALAVAGMAALEFVGLRRI
jgi:hypothetical protein